MYKKRIYIIKDKQKNTLGAMLCEQNFDSVFLSFAPAKNCKSDCKIVIFNQKNCKFVDFVNNFASFLWCEDIDGFAIVEKNNLYFEIVASSIDLDFNLKNVLNVFLKDKQNIQKEVPVKKLSYFDFHKVQFEKLLCRGEEEKWLQNRFGNSFFRRIKLGNKYFVFGVIFEMQKPKFVCVGFPLINKNFADEIKTNCMQFFGVNKNDNGFGYYLGFKSAIDGKIVKIDA